MIFFDGAFCVRRVSREFPPRRPRLARGARRVRGSLASAPGEELATHLHRVGRSSGDASAARRVFRRSRRTFGERLGRRRLRSDPTRARRLINIVRRRRRRRIDRRLRRERRSRFDLFRRASGRGHVARARLGRRRLFSLLLVLAGSPGTRPPRLIVPEHVRPQGFPRGRGHVRGHSPRDGHRGRGVHGLVHPGHRFQLRRGAHARHLRLGRLRSHDVLVDVALELVVAVRRHDTGALPRGRSLPRVDALCVR